MTKNRTTQEELTLARADHESLAAELKSMQESLAATEGQLALTRRNGGDADKMHALAADVATLRVLVAGQQADVAEAEAKLANLRDAFERQTASERYQEERRTYKAAKAQADEIIAEVFAAAEKGMQRYAEAAARGHAAVTDHASARDLPTFDHPRFDGYSEQKTRLLRAAWSLYGEKR